jgi:hypothetical protein
VKSRVLQESRVSQLLRSGSSSLCAVALVAALALLLVPAGASAASPVLEFVVPGHSLPISFTTASGPVTAEMAGSELVLECAESHGEGQITGPRSVVATYQFTGCKAHEPGKSLHKCKSSNVEEEIATGPIEADLVFIDQGKDEVGMLLNPNGGPTQPYISFECGGVSAAGFGPFLSPGSPINQDVSEFTMTLKRSGSTQTVTEYEGEKGEKLQAIPTGEKEKNGERVDTSVEMTVAVHTSVPVEIRAITAAEVEAKQQEEAAAKKKQEEEAATAAAKKHQEEEAIAAATAAKKHQEEAVAAKKHQEEAEKPKSKPTRAQLLTKALRACEKQPKKRRARCIASAHKKYGAKVKKKGRHKGSSPGIPS